MGDGECFDEVIGGPRDPLAPSPLLSIVRLVPLGNPFREPLKFRWRRPGGSHGGDGEDRNE